MRLRGEVDAVAVYHQTQAQVYGAKRGEERVAKWIEWYCDRGMTAREIAEKDAVCGESVRRWLKRSGVQMRRPGKPANGRTVRDRITALEREMATLRALLQERAA